MHIYLMKIPAASDKATRCLLSRFHPPPGPSCPRHHPQKLNSEIKFIKIFLNHELNHAKSSPTRMKIELKMFPAKTKARGNYHSLKTEDVPQTSSRRECGGTLKACSETALSADNISASKTKSLNGAKCCYLLEITTFALSLMIRF